MAIIEFAGVPENVIGRNEYPQEKIREKIGRRTVAVIGYTPEARQAVKALLQNGFEVFIGDEPESKRVAAAACDGLQNRTGSLGEICSKADIIHITLPDNEIISGWETISPHLTPGKTVSFSSGFAITYGQHTGVAVPSGCDVILLANRGPALTRYGEGGYNAAYAVFQDASAKARETAVALGFATGAVNIFETEFSKETYAELTGERGTLMGAIQGIFAAQYQVLRENGHTPTEAYNKTVEEFTRSLMPLVGENGMDWLYKNSGPVSQLGATDWWKMFRNATLPVFKNLYQEVRKGREAQRYIDCMGDSKCSAKLSREVNELAQSELWQVARDVRNLDNKQ